MHVHVHMYTCINGYIKNARNQIYAGLFNHQYPPNIAKYNSLQYLHINLHTQIRLTMPTNLYTIPNLIYPVYQIPAFYFRGHFLIQVYIFQNY